MFGEKTGKGFNFGNLERIASQTKGKLNPDAEELLSEENKHVEQTDLSYIFVLLAGACLLLEIFKREIGFRSIARFKRSFS